MRILSMESSHEGLRQMRPVAAYFLLWAAVVIGLRMAYGFAVSEVVPAFLVFAFILPALCLLATRGIRSQPYLVLKPHFESAALVGYLLVIAVILVTNFGSIGRVTTEPLRSLLLLVAKLSVFVLLPAAILVAWAGYRVFGLIPISLRWHDLRPALWISLVILLMQGFLGRGLHDIRLAHVPVWAMALAIPLSFGWLLVEVGLVEEFFFRALLQERLHVLLRSPWGGVVLAATLFGLVHAPGLYLRTTATQESLPAHPPLLLAIGYSIAVTSLAGLFLGVLWMRTKNLAVVAIVHAAGDLLPNLVPWMKAFHLVP